MVNSNKRGGEFIQKGTYGCVFRPPLKCLNPSSGFFRRRSKVDLNAKFKTGYVSKLMTDDNFNLELYEVIAISNALKLHNVDIAWQNKYLVLPLYEDGCVIDIKNKENLKDIDASNWPHPDPKKQRANCNFMVEDITKKVKDYKSLNMVDGGGDLIVYLKDKMHNSGPMNATEFHKFNTLLIDLLVNGIYKLNQFGVYHFDIKATNIVYNEREGQMRLIDWGFSRYINKQHVNTPAELIGVTKKLQVPGQLYYGATFGNGLIDLDFNLIQQNFQKFMDGDELDTTYLLQLNKYDKKGSMNKLITQNYELIVSKDKLHYFKNVYLPNNDLFAFLVMYRDIYDYIDSPAIKQNIDALIETYVLTDEYATKAYDINELEEALYNLSDETIFQETLNKKSPIKAKGRTKKRKATKCKATKRKRRRRKCRRCISKKGKKK